VVAVYQCGWCWEYSDVYTEVCRFCGSEAVVMVTSEDVVNNGKTKWKTQKTPIFIGYLCLR
jgi:protein-disulfide isomerase-like protein with CxxC motif